MAAPPDWGANLANLEATPRENEEQQAPAPEGEVATSTQPQTPTIEPEQLHGGDSDEQQIQPPNDNERPDTTPQREDLMDVDVDESERNKGGEDGAPQAAATTSEGERCDEVQTNAAQPLLDAETQPMEGADMEGVEAAAPAETEQQDALPEQQDALPEQQDALPEQQDDMQTTEMDMDGDDHPTPIPAIQMPDPFTLSLHDSTIKCICPPGTTRLAGELAFMGVREDGARWTHIPCKPYTADLPAGTAEEINKAVKDSTATGKPFNMQALVTQMLGHEPNKKQQFYLKNFTSTFICDGPCPGEKPHSDFFLCKKCCAWQHKSCMLYGERHDRGGPVCNRCYMNFVLHHEEIEEWQRKRLLMAVKEGWDYLNSPENSHQEWRRAWIRQWLARFFAHNQVVFRKYLAAKRQAARIAQAQAYFSRVKTLPQSGDAKPTKSTSADIKTEDEQKERRQSTRKQPKRKSAPEALLDGDEPMEDADEDEDDDAHDSDEIVVSTKPKGGKAKVQPKGKKPGDKRKDPSPMSSPVVKKKKPDGKSRAPRKSAPSSFGAFASSRSDEDDDVEPDDEELEMFRPEPSSRRKPAAPPANISCRCKGAAPTVRDCFKCRDCGIHQHKGCAIDVEDGLSVVCNFCFTRGPLQSQSPPPTSFRPPAPLVQPPTRQPAPPASFTQGPKPQPPPVQQAPAPPQQAAQPAQQYVPALRDEVNHLCATVLWREYCSIPMPVDDDDEEEGNTAPVPQPPPPAQPPQDWLTECQTRLLNLLTAAGQEKTASYLQPVLATWPRQNHQIMKALRDLAVEEIFHGSYQGKRRRLGVVLEVLGLEEKGRFWKGAMA